MQEEPGMRISSRLLCAFVLIALTLGSARAEEIHRPFILSTRSFDSLDQAGPQVIQALEEAGFDIAGTYSPYEGAWVAVITDGELKRVAAASDFGGYGVIQRVSLTLCGDAVQLAWTNPVYWAHAYRLAEDLASVARRLNTALGGGSPFGSKEGLRESKLRKYHYMMLMPYFDDPVLLAEHDSHEAALETIERGLKAGAGGVERVCRVSVPGKEEILFCVGLKEGPGADAAVMTTVDFGELKQTAHLPYELLVAGARVYMLHGKFRIAVSFPDLSMGTFMKIVGAPGGIKDALEAAAGGS